MKSFVSLFLDRLSTKFINVSMIYYQCNFQWTLRLHNQILRIMRLQCLQTHIWTNLVGKYWYTLTLLFLAKIQVHCLSIQLERYTIFTTFKTFSNFMIKLFKVFLKVGLQSFVINIFWRQYHQHFYPNMSFFRFLNQQKALYIQG